MMVTPATERERKETMITNIKLARGIDRQTTKKPSNMRSRVPTISKKDMPISVRNNREVAREFSRQMTIKVGDMSRASR